MGSRERRVRLRALRWQRKLWCKSRLGYMQRACGFSRPVPILRGVLVAAGCRVTFVRIKKIGRYEYLYLVENVREGRRHIKALGRRDAVENSDPLDGMIASAARHSRRSIVLSSFYRGELTELRRYRS